MLGTLVDAHELDELRVGQQAIVDRRGERLGVRLRIVDRHLDDERAEIGPTEPLDDLAVSRQRAPPDIEPRSPVVIVDEVRGLDDERVTFPAPNGITLIPGIGVGIGARPSR